MPGAIETLFADGAVLAYRLTRRGAALGTQWTRYVGKLGGERHAIEVALEVTLGAASVRRRGALVCTDDGAPLLYRVLVRGAPWTFVFGAGVEARLPTGETYALGDVEIDCLDEIHVPGFAALMIASSEHGRRSRFHTDRLAAAPCLIKPEGPVGFTTSHDEQLRCDERGLVHYQRGDRSYVADRADDIDELPGWVVDDVDQMAPACAPYVAPMGPFRVVDVALWGPTVQIGGALTIPDGPGPFPGALYLHGSGRPDRHGIAAEIDTGAHQIVDALAAERVVGLRCDSRGAGTTVFGPDGLAPDFEALVADASAQLEFLAAQQTVDRDGVFVVGHSQGGAVALALATRRPDLVAGVVLLAASGRPLVEVVKQQLHRQGLSASHVDDVASGLGDVATAHGLDASWLAQRSASTNCELIAALRCRVLICHPREDRVLDIDDGRRLLDAAKAGGTMASLAEFDELDHFFRRPDSDRIESPVTARIAAFIHA